MSTLSLPVRLAFGIGQLAEAVKNQGFNVFLLDFIQFPRGAKMGEVESAITAALGERQAAMSGSGEGSSPSESAMR